MKHNTKIILAAIMLFALLIRLLVSWQPVPILVERIVLDDSLYGYQIARNIASGNGITYNGLDLTNGFQPLWVFLIAPVYLLTENIHTAINLILSLQAVMDVLIIFLIYKLGKQVFTEEVGVLAGFIWAVNPLILFQTMSGIDVTLYIVLVLTSIILYNKIKDSLALKNSAILGALLGLTFLARGDGILLFAVVTAHILLTRKKFILSKEFLAILITALVVVSPWLMWNITTFGTLTPSSHIATYGSAHGLIPFYDLQEPRTFLEVLSMVGESFIRAFGSLANQMGVVDFNLSLYTILLVPIFLLGIYGFLKSYRKMIVSVGFCLMLVLFYAGYMWGVQIRYLTPIIPFIALFIASAFSDLSGRMGGYTERRIYFNNMLNIFLLAVLIAFVMAVNINGIEQWERGYFPWQKHIYEDALWIRDNIPNDEIVGSFASGIPIYFNNHTTINLDGILNYDAIDAIYNKSMYAYMKSRNITYWEESSYHNQSAIVSMRKGEFDITVENQWRGIFGDGSNMTLRRNMCDVFRHMRGFDMLVCFFVMGVK